MKGDSKKRTSAFFEDEIGRIVALRSLGFDGKNSVTRVKQFKAYISDNRLKLIEKLFEGTESHFLGELRIFIIKF